ncbi:hypothetical protein ACGFZA_37120 [Streptomyces sp. NPDC048211]|uniref:hypothetical protein n=1 Tax=Streptomyces sp. NPDC048211 TaxID=3365516 RepID=UPI00371B5CE3
MADFGSECRECLRGSDTEASISLPVAKLVETFGARWKLSPRLHPEHPLPEARVRPDCTVETSGRLKLKAPGQYVTPDGFTKRDREQWELMRGPRWPGFCGRNSGAQVRLDEGSCGGDAVGVRVGGLCNVEGRDAAQPVLRVVEVVQPGLGAGGAV